MMKHTRIAASAALAAGLLLSGNLVADELSSFWHIQGTYHDETSGTFVSSIVDTNGDGIPGNMATSQGRSSRGRVTVTSFSEFNPFSAGPSPNCPATAWQFPFVEGSVVLRFAKGDQVFLDTVEAVFCADLASGMFEFTHTSVVVGGTGRYEGATGTIHASGEGSSLSFDPSGILHFGWMTIRHEGTISRGEARISRQK